MVQAAQPRSATTPLYPPTVTPPPQPLTLLPFLAKFIRNPLESLPQQVYEEPAVVFETRRNVIAWISAPSLIEDVLVRRQDEFAKNPAEHRVFEPMLGDGILTSEGQLWRWQRRVLAPLFRHAEILRYVPTMSAAAEGQLARWRRHPSGSMQQIDRDMTATTFAVISRTMLDGGEPAEAEIIRAAGADFLEPISWEIAYALLRLPRWIPHPGSRRMRRAAQRLRGAMHAIVARRRGTAGQGTEGDLLGRLLAARDPETSAPMSDEQLVDNLLTLLEAGHETTAKALTWTLYLLARAPEWQERVRREVADVAGDAPIAAAHIDKLYVTQQVIKEAMRLYPPAPVMTRFAPNSARLGGFDLKPGTTIVLPVFAIHRHRRLWDDPDRFDPTRFTPENEARYSRTQFMPFGGGARVCIGMSFAMVEATVLLATFVRGASFGWDGQHMPQPISRVTLRPKGGMPLAVTPL